MRTPAGVLALGVLIALFTTGTVEATTVRLLTLTEIVDRADRVFRGVVLSAEPETVAAGGGTIPVMTYRIKVDEAMKGRFDTIKGARVVELRLLRAPHVAGLPEFEVGESYLMMTTRPSAIGMSTTVGLKQGYFRVRGKSAVNGYGATVMYEPLVAKIRSQVAKGAVR